MIFLESPDLHGLSEGTRFRRAMPGRIKCQSPSSAVDAQKKKEKPYHCRSIGKGPGADADASADRARNTQSVPQHHAFSSIFESCRFLQSKASCISSHYTSTSGPPAAIKWLARYFENLFTFSTSSIEVSRSFIKCNQCYLIESIQPYGGSLRRSVLPTCTIIAVSFFCQRSNFKTRMGE